MVLKEVEAARVNETSKEFKQTKGDRLKTKL
jgi:hypothetical protein